MPSPATTARIRLCTRESETVTVQDSSVKSLHPDALDTDTQGGAIETFFTDPAHALTMANERAALWFEFAPHIATETDAQLDIGGTIALTPEVPSFRAVDADKPLDRVMRMKGYAIDSNSERRGIELHG